MCLNMKKIECLERENGHQSARDQSDGDEEDELVSKASLARVGIAKSPNNLGENSQAQILL